MTVCGYPGANTQVNLQTGVGKGSGACHGSHQPMDINLWCLFYTSFLK